MDSEKPVVDAEGVERPNENTSAPTAQAIATRDGDAPPQTTRDNPNPLWTMPVEALFDMRKLPMAALYGLAKQLARSDLLDPGEGRANRLWGYPDNVFMLLLKGAALGIDVSTTLAEVNIIGSKLVVSANLQFALVQRSGKMKVWRHKFSDDTRAVIEVQRLEWDKPTEVEWTFEQAKALGLHNRGKNPQYSPWNTQRANMLRKRAVTTAAREHAGDVVIAYDIDELDDVQPGTMPAPQWSPAPATKPQVSSSWGGAVDDDIPDMSTPPQEVKPTPTGGAIDYDRVLDDFKQVCQTATSRQAVDAAQDKLLGPLFVLADKGDRAARGVVDEASKLYQAAYTRLRGK